MNDSQQTNGNFNDRTKEIYIEMILFFLSYLVRQSKPINWRDPQASFDEHQNQSCLPALIISLSFQTIIL